MKKCCVALWMIILFCLMPVCKPVCTLTGCLVCDPNDNTICISCDGINGFYLTSTTCSPCTSSRGTHCATCDSNQCLTCITGWTLNSSGSISYYFYSTTNLCLLRLNQ